VVDQLAMRLIRQLGGRLHVTLVCDCHSPDIPEPPYPKHCAAGTDEPDIDPDLQWLASMGCATTVHKDCIDGLIGSIHPSQSGHEYEIHLLTLLKRFAPGRIIVVGDCTELCVTDLVSSLLSARNHGLLSSIPPFPRADEKLAQHIASLDICVYEPGCATYHLADRHPSDLAHHVGMWMMASRGARILKAIL
jgi:hypothetical protein